MTKLFYNYDEIEQEIRNAQIPYDYDTREYPIEVLIHKFNNTKGDSSINMLFVILNIKFNINETKMSNIDNIAYS